MIFTEKDIYIIDGAKQELPGFDEKYANIVDYILKITDEIWEQRAVWVIYETYTDDVLIHTGTMQIHGVETVVSGTIKTLSAFPDRKMDAEAVVWSEDGKDKFFSSHRILSSATNLGTSDFGKATGKKVFFRTIADCAVAENKIYEEWLVRDNLHLVQSLGFDPVEMAKKDQRYKDLKNTPDQNDISKEVKKKSEKPYDLSIPEDLVQSLFENVWATRNFDELENYYHKLGHIHAICDNDLLGPWQLRNYLQNLFASFPNASVEVQRVTSNRIDEGYEVAVRWRLEGHHTGNGFFTPSSGKNLVVLGISHYIIKNGRIAEEWMLFDGFDVLCQIHSDVKPASVFGENGVSNSNLENKKSTLQFIEELNRGVVGKTGLTKVFKKYLSKDVVLNVSNPFNGMKGINSYEKDFWQPLLKSFPDLEIQPYIVIGGEYNGRECVSFTGNFIGTWKKDWLGIPATNQPTWLRFGGQYIFEKGKITEAYYFLDMLDIFRQAGFNFFPNKGIEMIVPAPMTGDGIVDYPTEASESKKSCDLTNAMIDGLLEYDGESLDSMAQERFWDVENMMWYGPAGIGTTKGLKGFQDNHQIPFLEAFPNRGVLEESEMANYSNIGDGNYTCHFGFPVMNGKHTGNGWLGLKASDNDFTIRVMDFWRREGDKLKENWVIIDMLDLLEQFGVDVFKMMKK